MTTPAGNKKHAKHAKLARATIGDWGRNELAILGAPCDVIKRVADNLVNRLGKKWNIAYVDADHDATSLPDNDAPFTYVDQIHSRQIRMQKPPDIFERRALFNEQQLVLVNGNHFTANAQVVMIDNRKPLVKKLEQLTQVVLILTTEGAEIPAYLMETLQDAGSVPVLNSNDDDGIAAFVENYLDRRTPELNGLVLAGGKSLRMGTDKGLLNYHGKTQRLHVYEMLQPLCKEVYLSCNQEQSQAISNDFEIIKDQFIGLGPIGGILSALQSNPDRAWLAIACDLPFLTHEIIELLIKNRNPAKFATAFKNEEQGFPEPMITIWEPRSYPLLLNYLSMGYSCPRKVLINSAIELVSLPDLKAIENINEPEDYQQALKTLKHE